jgi:transposase
VGEGEKKAAQEGRTIVFIDEAAFYLLPGVVRTYAPRGQTPILRVPLTRDHLSAISAITPQGKLFMMVQDTAFKGPAIVRFLRHVLHHIPGKLLIIWDGLPAHRGQVVKDFLAAGGTRRIHLERLPGYAPDLNPDEGIWHYLKHVEMKNLCCHDFTELRDELRKATARLRHKTDMIVGCFQLAGLAI